VRRTIVLLSTIAVGLLLASGVALAASTVVEKTFTNSDGISILSPIGASPPTAANPYPSAMSVSGFNAGSSIRDVNLKLSGFTHPAPKDVDIILQHGDQSAIVMSDVGCFSVVEALGLTLDDEAANAVPDDCGSPLTSGSYQPIDYEYELGLPSEEEDATFPSPANTLPTDGSALSVFDGTDPNGTWNLFVVDDKARNEGQFAGGWSLEITADSPDTKAPRVTKTTVPAAGATRVAPWHNVKATFTEAMDASPTATDGDHSTINGTTFTLFKQGSTTKVAAAVSYDATTKKATLNPNANLQRGTKYRAVVTTGAQDLAGNRLDQNSNLDGLQQKTWTFTIRN
jgi:subtilisin-like proprotein convertase family protein